MLSNGGSDKRTFKAQTAAERLHSSLSEPAEPTDKMCSVANGELKLHREMFILLFLK